MAAAASIASTGIVLEVVTKDNYLNWSTLVKNYLMGKGLWDNIIEGDINPDHIPDWKSKNRKALHAIQLSCGYQTLRQIRNCETAREAWNHLKNSFSEDLKAYQHDIEQGLQNDLGRLHNAVKKGLWKEANSIISSNKDIIFEKSSSNGWTALHVAVAAGQEEIMKKLVEIGKESLLTETDWQGYTPLALAAESTDDKEMAEWMVSKGGKDLLTMKIKPNDGKGDIPVLLAAAKGHKKMTRFHGRGGHIESFHGHKASTPMPKPNDSDPNESDSASDQSSFNLGRQSSTPATSKVTSTTPKSVVESSKPSTQKKKKTEEEKVDPNLNNLSIEANKKQRNEIPVFTVNGGNRVRQEVWVAPFVWSDEFALPNSKSEVKALTEKLEVTTKDLDTTSESLNVEKQFKALVDKEKAQLKKDIEILKEQLKDSEDQYFEAKSEADKEKETKYNTVVTKLRTDAYFNTIEKLKILNPILITEGSDPYAYVKNKMIMEGDVNGHFIPFVLHKENVEGIGNSDPAKRQGLQQDPVQQEAKLATSNNQQKTQVDDEVESRDKAIVLD
ncbi:Ankyrin repeat [Sesbania bispinosa]|nr:Ankyrin repeat [Sesbania bispinosa]